VIRIDAKLEQNLKLALAEDTGTKDLTSSLIPPQSRSRAVIYFKEDVIVCGLPVIERIFRIADEDLRFLPVSRCGETMQPRRPVCYVEGLTRSILTAERTALNFLSRMTAVATKTRAFVDRVQGTQAEIYDTRKTAPAFRVLDRYAVATGGGRNHRFGLFDGVLLKENHLNAMKNLGLGQIVRNARSRYPKNVTVGVEVESLEELSRVLGESCDYVLLDNFPLERVKEAVALRRSVKSRVPLEVSGGVRLENVRAYAECGVERISVGSLTHSVKAADVTLNLVG